ncbi:MAG: hypothetical protein ACOCZ5_01840 [bacterium]
MRKAVYLSFPYRNDSIKNIELVDILINKLAEVYPDYLIISPLHLFGWVGKSELDEMEYDDDIMVFDLKLVDICDKVWIFDYTGKSVGCCFERLEGIKTDKDVRVWTVDEIEQLLGVGIDDIC